MPSHPIPRQGTHIGRFWRSMGWCAPGWMELMLPELSWKLEDIWSLIGVCDRKRTWLIYIDLPSFYAGVLVFPTINPWVEAPVGCLKLVETIQITSPFALPAAGFYPWTGLAGSPSPTVATKQQIAHLVHSGCLNHTDVDMLSREHDTGAYLIHGNLKWRRVIFVVACLRAYL